MSLISIGDLLGRSLKNAGISGQVASAIILEEFEKICLEILGNDMASKIKPLYIKNKILTVACLSAPLAQELRFRERQILHTINEGKKNPVIETIRYIL